MQFKLEYTLRRTFDVPDNATDEEYDALKKTVIDSLTLAGGELKVTLVEKPAPVPPKYEINKDCD